MSIPEEVQEAREVTAQALRLELSKVEYITDELLAEYAADAEDDGSPQVTETSDGITQEPGTEQVASIITFGNRLVFGPGYVWYSQGKPGFPSYACGTMYRKRWGAVPGDDFTPLGGCERGITYYRLMRR
jgi:hypothetical protein